MKRRRPRTCVACREEAPKREMLRVARTPEGVVRLDLSGKTPGRGAYICVSEECLAVARKKDVLAKALKTRVDDALYEEILAVIREKMKESSGTP